LVALFRRIDRRHGHDAHHHHRRCLHGSLRNET
jgi:hypothetical protein